MSWAIAGLTKRSEQDLLLHELQWRTPSSCGHVCPSLHTPLPPGKLIEEKHKFKASLSNLVRPSLKGNVIVFSCKPLNYYA